MQSTCGCASYIKNQKDVKDAKKRPNGLIGQISPENINETLLIIGHYAGVATVCLITEKDMQKLEIYQGWDLSVGKDPNKGDYTACVTFGIDSAGNYYWLDVFRARIDFPERLKKVIDLYNRFPMTRKIRIEENTFQSDTVQLLKKNSNLPIEGVKTTGNKQQRFAEELAPLFENRKVFLKKEMVEAVNELLTLPYGQYDDICDSFLIGKRGLGIRYDPQIRWIG